MIDAKDPYTTGHSERVARIAVLVGGSAGLSAAACGDLYLAGLLHDVDKIGTPDAVLLKPGKLTPEEWVDMRRHPDIGHQMIQQIEFLSIPANIVLSHQERWDGQGYPRNLRREEIHIGARIFAVADTLDAMTSDRPYRKGTTFANAVQEIARCGGTQFDPEVVRAFLDIGEDGLLKIKAEMVAKKAEMLKRNEELLRDKRKAADDPALVAQPLGAAPVEEKASTPSVPVSP